VKSRGEEIDKKKEAGLQIKKMDGRSQSLPVQAVQENPGRR
jgi:hypothetical protein